jgi:hypothetical protein
VEVELKTFLISTLGGMNGQLHIPGTLPSQELCEMRVSVCVWEAGVVGASPAISICFLLGKPPFAGRLHGLQSRPGYCG